ncbi:MAG: cytokinin riboside 5'-monophosphate phosphoribohydrolase [bacterium]|nr:MAG: cytokinin riboside 5'-monophosphate phosphoribohydrolase [bacterium]
MKNNHNSTTDPMAGIYGDFPDHLTEKEVRKLRSIFTEFVAGFKIMMDKGPFVSVFGSSKTNPADPKYDMGRKLGQELVRNGFAVLTGGGPGLMEAANRGAHDANGRSMGINISIPDEQTTNPYTDPSITINHFFVRKVLLLKYSTAYVFLPGGYGTLDELFETVTLMQTKKIKRFPMVLMNSEHWAGLLDWIKTRLKKDGFIDVNDMDYLTVVDSVDEAVSVIKNARQK